MSPDMPALYKKLSVLTLGVGLVLLAPLMAMQFTDEVAWTATDFVAAGALLFGAGMAYVVVTTHTRAHPLPVAILIAGLLLLVWVQLAVGLFDAPFAGT